MGDALNNFTATAVAPIPIIKERVRSIPSVTVRSVFETASTVFIIVPIVSSFFILSCLDRKMVGSYDVDNLSTLFLLALTVWIKHDFGNLF